MIILPGYYAENEARRLSCYIGCLHCCGILQVTSSAVGMSLHCRLHGVVMQQLHAYIEPTRGEICQSSCTGRYHPITTRAYHPIIYLAVRE